MIIIPNTLKKLSLISLFVLLLFGCGNNNKQLETLKQEVANKDNEINNLTADLEGALKEKTYYQDKLDNNGTVTASTIKDSFLLKLTVINKIEKEDGALNNVIIASFEDEDHNSPLAITIENDETFEDLQLNESYTFNLYFIFVVSGDDLRYEVALLDYFQ